MGFLNRLLPCAVPLYPPDDPRFQEANLCTVAILTPCYRPQTLIGDSRQGSTLDHAPSPSLAGGGRGILGGVPLLTRLPVHHWGIRGGGSGSIHKPRPQLFDFSSWDQV